MRAVYIGNGNELDTLIDYIFPSLSENLSNRNYITSRAILSTRKDWVDMINMKMIGHFQGEEIVYHSLIVRLMTGVTTTLPSSLTR
jgi:ATP-dependent DNA helicase PIF1